MKVRLQDLTLEEKLTILTGKDYWRTSDLNGKVYSLSLADGPNGVRMIDEETEKTKKATAMPNVSVLANSWSKEMAYLTGATIADECVELGADVLLAPGVNIKRTPLNGRNFEYFSEDPYLAGTLAKEYIEGVQDNGVGTSLKHFTANNREHDRLHQTSEIDERAIREIYVKPFEIAVKAKPWTVMCSYNLVNGVWTSEHKKLLKNTLRDDLGFDGLIVSDWGAVHNYANSVKATLDLRMPYEDEAYAELKKAYDKGELTIEEIDYCVSNVLKLIEKSENAKKSIKLTKEKRHQNAVEIAKEGIVLLKNDDGILPINKNQNISVVGKYADIPSLGGGGAAHVITDFVQTPLSKVISEKLGVPVQKGTAYNTGSVTEENYSLDYVRNGRGDYEKIYNSDVAILCVGEQAPLVAENYDRQGIRLPVEQEELIIRASELNENLVVLVYAGSAIDMSAWIDRVKAVVFVGFAGEGVNEALASILVGEVNPSGKLAETFPICLEDTYTGRNIGDKGVEWYSDGIFVGYRYYDKAGLDVEFAFGHGLSYSQFEYSDLKVEKIGPTEYDVSYSVKNISNVDGKEVSQIYVREVLPFVLRPEKELKGFSKDLIKAGETKRITEKLCFDAFAYYSTAYDAWHIDDGSFEIMVGASSRDIRLKQKIKIEK